MISVQCYWYSLTGKNNLINMEQIKRALDERIMIFDGGMGTMIQALNFEEKDFRGIYFS